MTENLGESGGIDNHLESRGSNTSEMSLVGNGLSVNDSKDAIISPDMWGGRDQQLLKTCCKYGVDFIWPKEGETALEMKERREELQRKCKAARQRQKRMEMSPEVRDTLRARQAERMRMKRSQMTPEERRASRARQAERMRLKRRNSSFDELKKSIQDASGTSGQDAVIEVSVDNSCCSQCGKQSMARKILSEESSKDNSAKILNFGLAPVIVAERFSQFCSSYNSLSEALMDLLDLERLLTTKYRFISSEDSKLERVIAVTTAQDYSDVLETTINALKKLTENSKYKSVANTIEEILFSYPNVEGTHSNSNETSIDP